MRTLKTVAMVILWALVLVNIVSTYLYDRVQDKQIDQLEGRVNSLLIDWADEQ